MAFTAAAHRSHFSKIFFLPLDISWSVPFFFFSFKYLFFFPLLRSFSSFLFFVSLLLSSSSSLSTELVKTIENFEDFPRPSTRTHIFDRTRNFDAKDAKDLSKFLEPSHSDHSIVRPLRAFQHSRYTFEGANPREVTYLLFLTRLDSTLGYSTGVSYSHAGERRP